MYDPDADVIQQRKTWTEFLPAIPVFPSLNAVLDSDAEAVVVEGRVYQNLDYAQQALEAGKHVLLEKPAGVDLKHLEHVQEIAVRKGLMLQMAYMWRYNPAIHEIIRLVKSGVLGDIFYYRGHIPKPKTWHPETGVGIRNVPRRGLFRDGWPFGGFDGRGNGKNLSMCNRCWGNTTVTI